MKDLTRKIFTTLSLEYPEIKLIEEDVINAYLIMEECYLKKGKILVCGNGGSACDSEHIVGELMKGFLKKRPLNETEVEKFEELYKEEGKYIAQHLQKAIPAISLVSQTGISTAFINDVDPNLVYAQLAYGYGEENDILIGLSTSGNSMNVVNAVIAAKVKGMKTIGMTGEKGGKLKDLCDECICAPSKETFKIQEFHLPIYHALCAAVEEENFEK